MADMGRVKTALDDLQDLSVWAKSAEWRMLPAPKQTTSTVEFYRVVDAKGKLVFTLGFTAGDHQTRILVEALLAKGHALVAGASLTTQMLVSAEELAECQRMKEREGITDAYNDRQQSAWSAMRDLIQQVRIGLGRFATVKTLKP